MGEREGWGGGKTGCCLSGYHDCSAEAAATNNQNCLRINSLIPSKRKKTACCQGHNYLRTYSLWPFIQEAELHLQGHGCLGSASSTQLWERVLLTSIFVTPKRDLLSAIPKHKWSESKCLEETKKRNAQVWTFKSKESIHSLPLLHLTLKSETVSSFDEDEYHHQRKLTIYKTWDNYSTRLKTFMNWYQYQFKCQ